MTPIDGNFRGEHGELLSDLKQQIAQRSWTIGGRIRSVIGTVGRKVQPAMQLALAARKKRNLTGPRAGKSCAQMVTQKTGDFDLSERDNDGLLQKNRLRCAKR
jgi:hypothetical protein